MVKNIAKTVNKTNFAEVATYIDGALGRNDALIKVLSDAKTNGTFINRIKGEETTRTR